MEKDSKFNKSVSKNILANSQSKEFNNALREWSFTGKVNDYKARCLTCEMCEHEKLRYHFTITNCKTGIELNVGSNCILKFANIRVIDRHGHVASGNVRNWVISDALTEHQKELMLSSLRELWRYSVHNRKYIEKHVGHYHKNNAFYPTALFYLFEDFERLNIDYDPDLFSVYLRTKTCKESVIKMTDYQFYKISRSLSKEQNTTMKLLRYEHYEK